MRSRDIFGVLLAVASVTPLVVGGALVAAPRTEAEILSDAKFRVNLAGRQRMLTQRMTKAACFVALDVEREMHSEMLRKSELDFDRALKALRDGDEELGVLGEETSARVLKGLASVEEKWVDFKAAVDEMFESGDFEGENAKTIFTRNVPLLKNMNEVVSLIEQSYANPNEMLLASAVAINVAGRQRMLSQKIGKEFCQIELGWRPKEVAETLKKTVALFEASNDALRNGFPAAGIVPPPTPEIKAALDALTEHWLSVKGLVERAENGEKLDAETLSFFAKENDAILREMHAIVGMYERA